MLFWHEYNIKKALDDMPNFKAFQGTLHVSTKYVNMYKCMYTSVPCSCINILLLQKVISTCTCAVRNKMAV